MHGIACARVCMVQMGALQVEVPAVHVRECVHECFLCLRVYMVQMEALLKEEDSVVHGRKAARAALEDAKTAVFRVRAGHVHACACARTCLSFVCMGCAWACIYPQKRRRESKAYVRIPCHAHPKGRRRMLYRDAEGEHVVS